jgi:putative acetyltransferase
VSGLDRLTFRLAEAADLAAAARLHARSSSGLSESTLDARQLASGVTMMETEDYRQDLARSHLALAIDPNGEIVGSAGWIEAAGEPGTGRIRKVYIDPGYARRGLATRLVRDAEARAREAGCRRFVVRSSLLAVPFYETLGYVRGEAGTMLTPDGVALPVVFMEKRLEFRPATAADFPAIAKLHAHAFAVLAAAIHDARQIAAHTAITEAPDYVADLARSRLLLAVADGGAIVASAGWMPVEGEAATGRIRKVFVDPAYARRGLATRMVKDAEARAAAEGCRRLILRANLNAVPLYVKLGYAETEPGLKKAPGGVELPVVFMEKRLASS